MSVMASGQVNMKMKQVVPTEIIDLVNKEYIHVSFNALDYVAEFDGNWRIDDVIDAVKLLNPYIESGNISYWSDEGEAIAEFCNGMWCEEWQEHYYPSELPNADVSSTSRVAEILNTIANSLMGRFGSEYTYKLMLNKCNLSNDEIKAYELIWLKNDRTFDEYDSLQFEEEDWSEEDCLEWKRVAEGVSAIS